jgi:phospholipid-binding lipoprotein MlaA
MPNSGPAYDCGKATAAALQSNVMQSAGLGCQGETSLSIPLITAVLLSSSPVPSTILSPNNIPETVIIFTPGTGGTAAANPSLNADVPENVPELPVQVTGSLNPETAAQPNDTTDIVVQARRRAPPGDPLQAINAQSFAVTQSIDKAIVGPVSLGFAKVVPTPLRRGLHNFLANLNEPVVFINFLLQHKIGKAAETLGRFTINSTIGAAGLMDIAKRKPFHLPERRNSLADTLGFYGVKPGPFFFLPLVGPTTLRDVFGNTVDRLLLPTSIGTPFNKPAYTLSTGVGSALDYRAGFDAKLNSIRESADPYTAAREYYLQTRQAEIDGLHSMHKKEAATAVIPIESPTKAVGPESPAQSDRVVVVTFVAPLSKEKEATIP